MRVWRKRYELGNSELRKKKRTWYRRFNEDKDFEAWELLYLDFREKIGVSEEFQSYLDKIDKLIDLRVAFMKSVKIKKVGNKMVEVRDRFLLNKIKMLEAEVDLFEMQGNKGMTSTEILQEITKAQGVLRNEDNTTVEEYFTLIKQLGKWQG